MSIIFLNQFNFIALLFVFTCSCLSKSTHQDTKRRPFENYHAAKFEQYKINYGYSFSDSVEHDYRLKIYSDNLDFIEAHNSDSSNTAVLGETPWAHYTNSEFRKMSVRGFIPPETSSSYSDPTSINDDDLVVVPQRYLRSEGKHNNAKRNRGNAVKSPSSKPSLRPSAKPSSAPVKIPSKLPSRLPTSVPAIAPTVAPSNVPSRIPSNAPSNAPSYAPSNKPSNMPSIAPSNTPSIAPSSMPSGAPSTMPSVFPSNEPSMIPSNAPSSAPSMIPSTSPSAIPSQKQSTQPICKPSYSPSQLPTTSPSAEPSNSHGVVSGISPVSVPVPVPVQSVVPTRYPSNIPSFKPTISKTPTKSPTCSPTIKPTPSPTVVPPPAVDWTLRTVNGWPVVGPIKDQGVCASCWAFTAVSVMESAYTLKYGVHKAFSEQEVISCDINGQSGCAGGNELQVYSWTNSNGGLALESAYPYTSGMGTVANNFYGTTGTCITSGYTNDPNVKPAKVSSVKTGSTQALQVAVAQQPVAIAIDSASAVFQLYVSGVITTGCGNKTDHSVVLVGYNNTAKIPYFKIRNSWGSSWGNKGYAYISSDQKLNACNVLNYNNYVVF